MFGRRKQRAKFNNNQIYWNNFLNQHSFLYGINRGPAFIRQQPFVNSHVSTGNWNPYLHPYPVNSQQSFPNSHPFYATVAQNPSSNEFPYSYQQYPGAEISGYYGPHPSKNTSIFHNPLEPVEGSHMTMPKQPSSHPFMNPYPKQSFIPKQPSGVQSIMNSFKAQDGSFDVNKMVDTAGQMMNAVSQVSSMVKGIGGIFKA